MMNRLSLPVMISVVALVTGFVLLWPGDLFFLSHDFNILLQLQQSKWMQQNTFRPVTDITFWFDHLIWNKNAFGYHLTNGLLHIFATLLVYRFTRRLLQKYTVADERNHTALLSAALFFVFAFHSESLYWVTGRSGTLGTIFFLISASFYLKRQIAERHFLAQLFFFIGLFTYESVWIIPILFLLISRADVSSRTSSWKKEIKPILISIIVFAAYLALKYYYIHQFVAEYEARKFLHFDVAGLLTNYAKLIGRTFAVNAKSYVIIIIIAIVATVSLINLFTSKNRNLLFHGLLLMLWILSYLPYLSLGIDTNGTEGERYLYLPSVFFCIWVVNSFFSAKEPVWKNIIGVMFFALHIVLLYEHRRQYEMASLISKLTIDAVNDQQNIKLLQVENLPQENRGALIFRNGFEEAMVLFKKPNTADSVQVLSKSPTDFEFYPLIDVQQINNNTVKMKFETDPNLEF